LSSSVRRRSFCKGTDRTCRVGGWPGLSNRLKTVAQDNAAAEESLIERIFSAVEILAQYPQIGRDGRAKGTRELVIAGTPVVVAYRSRRSRVEALAVLHAARKWPEEF